MAKATANKKALEKEIFEKLSEDISVNAIQKKDFGKQKSEGYNIGYIVDRMNDTLIPYGWSWDFEILPIQIDDGPPRTFLLETFESTNASGKSSKKTTVSVKVKITIRDDAGEAVWVKESFGGCQILNNSLGDTLKGAQTDGMKKSLSYLGVGNAAFKGTINDQLRKFSYFKTKTIKAIGKYFNEVLKKEINGKTGLKFISDTVQKDYLSLDDVLYSDWLAVLDAVTSEDGEPEKTRKKTTKDEKKEPVKNEQKNKDGADQAETTEEQVDNPE